MKKIIMIVFLTVFVGLCVKAQEEKFLVGAGIGYATDISTPTISALGVYQITSQWEAAAGLTYFFPKDYGFGDSKLTWLGFDANAHYVFSDSEDLDFYGLAGLHITRVSTPSYEFQGHKVPSVSATNTGLNLGAGGRYQFSDSLCGFGEAKYVLADGGYFHLDVGILFRF